ncbi:hypothetical protein DMA12_19545 [Amycolatopsis balhimycina DSM 5908]|uniref:Uncharacterized protein n=1 Tax=Amycolatopsis balhimycina DSM 5908 TaxID=1081091 RepID=A0A428WJ87_AMYBA|nr:hypothetical protein [Amycolatopsis balhimycina]RSM43147.1 hypothetical protein DMA12_19545 [Amycolatopsis balhimycina DSM 5908]
MSEGDAELGGDGGSGLSGSEQDAGVGDLFAGQGARAAADAASGAGGAETFAGAFDDLLMAANTVSGNDEDQLL